MAAQQPSPVAASTPIPYPLTPSPLTPAQAAIPGRIECAVPISIRSSLIHPDRKGLYVDSAVSPGDILFTIRKPLFTIINDGIVARTRTCDNCFAYQRLSNHDDVINVASNVKRGVEAEIQFIPCKKCKVYYYCSEECYDAARVHHHQYECASLRRMVNSRQKGARDFVEDCDVRFVLRILCLAKGNHLHGAQLQEYLTMPTGASFHFETKEGLKERNQEMATILREHTKSNLTEDEILHIVCITIGQGVQMQQTILREVNRQHGGYWNTNTPNGVRCGHCFEPFIAIMRNDCNANTREYFDGVTYILQANRAMPANTEITRRFTVANDYQNRRTELMYKEGLDCKCALCLRGDLGPKGDLRERMLPILYGNYDPQADKKLTEQLSSDNRVILELESKGFGYNCPGMRYVYLSMFWRQFYRDLRVGAGDYKESLRLLLIIYYFIDPVACPAPLPEERFEVLYLLMHVAPGANDPRFKDSDVVLPIRKLIYHWRTKLVHYSQQLGGPDTTIARFHYDAFQRDLKTLDMPVYTDKDAITEDMNDWFRLLGLEEITYEQLSRT
ncbi:hypothetical protein OCU04_005397 [Sclerotinia nivalis]|uniref:MYND-type zinc finger protein samB n=1 Tax=Sclerotinia nivalis TaxID=352851 RepID=A0A9X0AP31_9HELO|nr:hypothetical protein OCU04_005397 [Sclerotinia nivalis]